MADIPTSISYSVTCTEKPPYGLRRHKNQATATDVLITAVLICTEELGCSVRSQRRSPGLCAVESPKTGTSLRFLALMKPLLGYAERGGEQMLGRAQSDTECEMKRKSEGV